MPAYEWSKEHNAWVKECNKCHHEFIGVVDQDKSVEIFKTYFSSRSGYTDGFDYRCKSCQADNRHGRVVDRNYWDAQWVEQEGKCAICRIELNTDSNNINPKTACKDHDHKTNLNRGWLCKSCNTNVAFLEVDGQKLKWIKSAHEYLIKHLNRMLEK